ncbi:MAG: hypothetical protein CV087_08285 [Candidatus Brocadia sp. WS118]|nr:MAG: hypothetical protein CV087_08285 [Candidatus Brocadia sp. WS118]
MSKPKGLKPIEQAYLDLFYVQNCLEQYAADDTTMSVKMLLSLAGKQKAALKLYRDTLYRAQHILEHGDGDK